MTTLFRLRLEKRLYVSRKRRLAFVVVAIVISFLLGGVAIIAAKASVSEAFTAFIKGAFGSVNAFAETLVQATPIILTGLAMVIALRGQIWNIGAEGQYIAGAMAAFWVSELVVGWPPPLAIGLMILTAMVGGALWAWVAGFLKVRYGSNELIVTIMQVYLIRFVLSFMLGGPWQNPDSAYLQTALIPESFWFPRLLPSSRFHAGFLLALLATGFTYFLMRNSILGYEIRALGINPQAAKFKGINTGRVIIMIMLLSGAIAGLGGAVQFLGIHHRLDLEVSAGYGYTGIVIALLGGLNPFGTIAIGLLFGALMKASVAMQIATGIPIALVDVIEGIVLVVLLAAEVMSRYRIRKLPNV